MGIISINTFKPILINSYPQITVYFIREIVYNIYRNLIKIKMRKVNKTIDDKAFQDLCYKHVLWLKSTYTAGDRLILINYDLSKINFDYMVLHLADLSYCDFSKNILINTEFCGANLRGSNFDFTYCHKVDFRVQILKMQVLKDTKGQIVVIIPHAETIGIIGIVRLKTLFKIVFEDMNMIWYFLAVLFFGFAESFILHFFVTRSINLKVIIRIFLFEIVKIFNAVNIYPRRSFFSFKSI